MPTKKKKFIDKKHAVTFRLVHRSQKDPLCADEVAPKHVFLEQATKQDLNQTKKRKSEQLKYGIYFDDDYNYLQHLRDVNSTDNTFEQVLVQETDLLQPKKAVSRLNLPSSVFSSNVEEKEGLLNKAAPIRGPLVDWDPDIVAALDDDYDFDDPENQLDDNFVVQANATFTDEDISEGSDADDEACEEETSSMDGYDLEEETKSELFTNYSLSSSVLPRTEELKTFDERFEKIFEEYGDNEIGCLDGEDIEGYIDLDGVTMNQLVEEYKKNNEPIPLKDIIQERIATMDLEEENKEDIAIIVTPKEERWDCESILSTYSNLYNHPKLITEPPTDKKIKISQRTGLPTDVLSQKKLTRQKLKEFNKNAIDEDSSDEDNGNFVQSVASFRSTASTIRSKNETPEERRARKSTIKQMRKERRMEKKSNKIAFKYEKKCQEQVLKNLRENLQVIKL